MQRGRKRIEQRLTASIRQTIIMMNKDPNKPLPGLDDLKVFDLPEYDTGNRLTNETQPKRRPFSELKSLFKGS